MRWIMLVTAGLFEVGWAIGLKYTKGFTRLWPTVWTLLAMVVSLWLLGVSMKSLPVGTAYTVWVGVGSVGTVILGIVLFGEPANAGHLISVALIIAGIIGIKLATPACPVATICSAWNGSVIMPTAPVAIPVSARTLAAKGT